tara:strand:+ start:1020 stop:2000 length:981 start_codon:yes stop_codon:yes gene_type:complete
LKLSSLPNSPSNLSLGFDIGGTNIRGLGLGSRGETTKLYQKSHLSELDNIIDSILNIYKEIQLDTGKQIESIGIGCAGLIDTEGVVRASPNILALENFPLKEAIEEKVEVSVTVENDANCAAWAEAQLGVAQGRSEALVVSLGTGIGAGIILNGNLHRGGFGFAGEVGHMVVEKDGLQCPCGKQGCWEQYASGSALGRLAQRMHEDGDIPDLASKVRSGKSYVTGELVGVAAQENHKEALQILEIFSQWVSLGIHNLVKVTDPSLIVIGGGIAEIGQPLIGAINRTFSQIANSEPNAQQVELVLAKFGNRAGSLGAALIAIKNFSK